MKVEVVMNFSWALGVIVVITGGLTVLGYLAGDYLFQHGLLLRGSLGTERRREQH